MNDQYRDDCQNYKQAEVAIDYVSLKWIYTPSPFVDRIRPPGSRTDLAFALSPQFTECGLAKRRRRPEAPEQHGTARELLM